MLGERLQINHMTARKNGVTVKHFQAWGRCFRYIRTHFYSNATCRSAKRFLEELLEKASFPILSIQVDGGSEFRQSFEDFCEEKRILLMVLSPAKHT